MPEIVSCPKCGFKVQMAESLLGRSVRCQSCDERFVATAEAQPSPPVRAPLLPDPPSEPPHTPEPPRRFDPPPRFDAPPRPPESRPLQRDFRDPEYRSVDDELPRCPGCGRGVAWDYRICPYCGEEFETEGRGRRYYGRHGPRRDMEGHRGAVIAGLGKASLVLGGLTLCLPIIPALVSVPLGITAWVMAINDLEGMRSGRVDPEGRAQTEDGRNHAVIGIVLACLFALGWFCFWLAHQ
jgi:hypothetical protein